MQKGAVFHKKWVQKGAISCKKWVQKGANVSEKIEKVNGIKIPYRIAPRRAGDIAECYANPEKAAKLFGWKAEKTLEDMCRDSWRWQSNHK